MAALSRRLRDTADTISLQAGELRRLCSDDYWDSNAGAKFRELSGELAGKLDDTYDRYDAAARAVETYGDELDRAQLRADDAWRAADVAETEHQAAVTAAAAAQPADTYGPGSGTSTVAVPTVAPPPDDGSHLEPARRILADAIGIRDEAARAAADAIGRVIDNDDVEDGFGDGFRSWVRDHADIIGMIASVAGWVATACGVLALAFACVPVIGTAIAGVLETVALVASAVSLVCNIVLLIGGVGSWANVALDVVGLATFGIGRAATSTAARSARAARGATQQAVVRAGREAAEAAGRPLAGRALNRLYLRAKRFSQGLNSAAAREAIDGAPGYGVPRLADVAEGFNPVTVARETVDDVRSLPQNWQALRSTDRAELSWRMPWDDAPATAGEIGAMERALVHANGDPTALGYASNARTSLHVLAGANITAVGTEIFGLTPLPDVLSPEGTGTW